MHMASYLILETAQQQLFLFLFQRSEQSGLQGRFVLPLLSLAASWLGLVHFTPFLFKVDIYLQFVSWVRFLQFIIKVNYRTVLSNMLPTSHVWLFKHNHNEKFKNSLPRSHHPHFKCSAAVCS